MLDLLDRTATDLLRDPYGLTLVLFVLAIFPGMVGIQLIILLPFTDLPSGGPAAVTEPITTKFLPAYISLVITQVYNENTYERLVSNSVVFGLWGGFWFGIAERIMHLVNGEPFLLLWTVSVGLHAVNGLLVGGTLYWRAKERWNVTDFIILIVGIISATALHIYWNVILL